VTESDPILYQIRSRMEVSKEIYSDMKTIWVTTDTGAYHSNCNQFMVEKFREGRFWNWETSCGEKHDTVTIRTVIHLDIPYSPEAYLQETGRAGRDGSTVEALLLYSTEDLRFADMLRVGSAAPPSASLGDTMDGAAGAGECPETPNTAPLAAERYTRMLDYALDTTRCRREQLLGFLGQEPASCSGCDVCDGRVLSQAEGEAQIVELVSRNPRCFTLREAAQLLRGAKSYEVVHRGLASYYGFGVLACWQEEEIEEALESLRCSGRIKVLKRGFWKNRITADKVGDDTGTHRMLISHETRSSIKFPIYSKSGNHDDATTGV
jgi:superfamily II DNA helicase RecQ